MLDRRGDAILFNPRLVEFAKHYHFEIRPAAVARGNEKGRVERAIRYARTSFWPARQVVEVRATLERVRVISAGVVVAEHARSFDRGFVAEDSAHVEALRKSKGDAIRAAVHTAFQSTAMELFFGARSADTTRSRREARPGLVASVDNHDQLPLRSRIHWSGNTD